MANIKGPYPIQVLTCVDDALHRRLKRLARKCRVSVREALRQLIAEATQ